MAAKLKIKIKVPEDKYSTNQGKWLIFAITKKYMEYKQNNKGAIPKTLHLGKSQSEILDMDPRATGTIVDGGGEINFTQNQSEVKFT